LNHFPSFPTKALTASDTVIISVIGSIGEAVNSLFIELPRPLRNRAHQNRADPGDVRSLQGTQYGITQETRPDRWAIIRSVWRKAEVQEQYGIKAAANKSGRIVVRASDSEPGSKSVDLTVRQAVRDSL